MAEDKEQQIQETRKRFTQEYLQDKADKYDSRDVDRLQTDDALVENYLMWRHCVTEDALKMIDESLKWRKEIGVNDLSESTIPKWCFETGATYLHGYDKEGNKLLWLRVKLHVRDGKTNEDKKKFVAFWLERYARREPGKLLTVVFDMLDSGLSNIDMDFVRFVINSFKTYYPRYLSKMVVFEMPWILNAAFKIVKSWLGPEAINVLKFVNKNQVQDYISIEYLPPHMGGTDPFKYSYPPLPDDDFQTPLCENGPIASEDDSESKLSESDLRDSVDSIVPKKMSINEDQIKQEDLDKNDIKQKNNRKASTVFKGPFLHISPAEELHFGSKESGERKCIIVLSNVTKNTVAFKVRTTAPEKYRVKPSNSSCEPGSTVDIVVSLHAAFVASLQDRFLVMAAEMEQPSSASTQELAQFWKELPRSKVMEHRLRCHVIENSKPSSLILKSNTLNHTIPDSDDLHFKLNQLLETNRRLEARIGRCIWFQHMLAALLSILVAIVAAGVYKMKHQDC
ncbi:motile sperm domain containing 2 S homeolog [Xenopus laevis]|uniref:LOC496299 protein n=1 Tax=Xenopus laevis TaxID=8355 RepID=Q2NL62_XENLA|nr:motile sperm domain containing 2 S homeolog [Xenopus laevis]AAI10927.1 LOC496299 protein [Xenopus laevis]